MSYYGYGMRPPTGRSSARFDTYYRCYPIVMLSGPDRTQANFGGKVFLPPSALSKLSTLNVTYPMIFELHHRDRMTHAGVLEFIAEEGRIYLPNWMMSTLGLEAGDLIQIKSTDLPPGSLIKLKPQSVDFLEISDPRAVLENAFRGFSCLTKNDIFQFSYNEQTFDILVEDVQPPNEKMGIVTMETDLKVEFSAPVGYKEPDRTSGTSTPASGVGGRAKGGTVKFQGTMAESINYSALAPGSAEAAAGMKVASSNFGTVGHSLKKGGKAPTPKPSTPVMGARSNTTTTSTTGISSSGGVGGAGPSPLGGGGSVRAGAQPLRLPEGKLFFGYDVKPLKKKGENGDGEEELGKGEKKLVFSGEGQTLRAGKKKGASGGVGPSAGGGSGVSSDAEGGRKK